MAKEGKRRGAGSRRTPSGRSGTGRRGKAGAHGLPAAGSAGRQRPAPQSVPPAQAPPEAPRSFRLGAIPGATPGKWIDAWRLRMPHVALELVPISVADQRPALEDLDAALVRLPIDDAGLHLIRLYDEIPVVVASAESHLAAADELDAADLRGEVLLPSIEDVLDVDVPGATTPTFGPLPTTADVIATVATGVGVAVVPLSLARLHHRKDVVHRPLRDGPTSTVALAWPRERTTADVETFVGIVRGRTANSSR